MQTQNCKHNSPPCESLNTVYILNTTEYLSYNQKVDAVKVSCKKFIFRNHKSN